MSMFGAAQGKKGRPYLGNVSVFARVTPNVEDEAKRIADRLGKSLSEYIREAVVAANAAHRKG